MSCVFACGKQSGDVYLNEADGNVSESTENDVEVNTQEPSYDESDPPEKIPIEIPPDDPKIIVWKSDRRLDLYDGEDLVKSYRIGLGFTPEGHKEREGDGRTPEGEYYVCVKNPYSRFYLALGISYPNNEDADMGLREGIITGEEYDSIIYAIRNRRQPPWNTALGGEIFIHGNGSHSDWTLGCAALDDEDIKELYDMIPMGTVVVINP